MVTPVNSKQWRSCIYVKKPVRTHHLDYQKKNVLKTVYYNNFIAKQETLTGCANYNKLSQVDNNIRHTTYSKNSNQA